MDEVIQVECYAGGRGEERPQAVIRGGRRRPVTRVTERWIEEAEDPAKGRRRWFRVEHPDGSASTIYHDLALDMWFFHQERASPSPGRFPAA